MSDFRRKSRFVAEDGSLDEWDEPAGRPPPARGARATWWVYGGLLLLLTVAGAIFVLLLPPIAPLPPEVAKDPLLVRGREIYFKNCATCHGERGRGDGPNAKNLKGRGPGNLTDPASWRRGDRPRWC